MCLIRLLGLKAQANVSGNQRQLTKLLGICVPVFTYAAQDYSSEAPVDSVI